MRQPQHRNRARTRTRRQPNPANKVYESNGPDVKVRGTPQQIADKYAQLGRDALSAGDMVKAENYFQHAEHYLRIIAAAQEQIQQRRQQQEQRRQEAAARRRGNGRDQQPDVAAAGDSGDVPERDTAQVVVLPTEAADAAPEAAANGGNGDAASSAAETSEAEVQPAWEGSAPQFLTRPVEVLSEDAGETEQPVEGAEAPAAAAQAEATDDSAAAPRARRTVRRRSTRTRRASAADENKPEASDG